MYRNRVLREIDTERVSEIIIPYSVALEHEKHLLLEHSYIVYDAPQNSIRLQFITQNIMEMRDARELLVDVVEGLLERINDSALAGSLFPQPFTADQLEIYINFQSWHTRYADPFYIGWVVLEDGMAYYYAASLKDFTHDYWYRRYEPYFKSRSFVMIEREAQKEYRKDHPHFDPYSLDEKKALHGVLTDLLPSLQPHLEEEPLPLPESK